MNRKQAINYLASSGMTDEQINEVVTAINRTETKEFKQEFLRVASYIDCLLECSDEQKETLINFIARLSEYMPWYEDDDFEIDEHTPERTETHACDCGKKETHGDVIRRSDVADKLTRMVNELEGIYSDIRIRLVDDSVCGLCEYDCDHGVDGYAYECPGFDKDDCFKLKEEYREAWVSTKDLPSAEPERKKGEWVEKALDNFRKYEVVCSECGSRYIGNYDAYDEPCDFNYCPNCGAKMEVYG